MAFYFADKGFTTVGDFFLSLQFFSATTVTTIKSTIASLNDVTFPSLYVCNTNQVSWVFFCSLSECDITEQNKNSRFSKKDGFDFFLPAVTRFEPGTAGLLPLY